MNRFSLRTWVFFPFLSLLFLTTNSLFGESPVIKKVLHITLHRGCALEFEGVAKELSLDLTTWFIYDLPRDFMEGVPLTNAIYNMGHERANRIWTLHEDFFNSFDAVIVSDTAPLSRIFLQNGWEKPLFIWICNRFDYYDGASLDCNFPDKEYYSLFSAATKQENVRIIAYTAFEHYYAKAKGIDTGSLTITPCGAYAFTGNGVSSIPENVNKKESFFLPSYHNETIFMNLSDQCSELGIPNYRGRYAGAQDLEEFRGIIHLPYAWSNLALFENMLLGIPYFVPSLGFLKKLMQKENYFLQEGIGVLFGSNPRLYELVEWYSPVHQDVITYFDSWGDLQKKIQETDYDALRIRIQAHALKYKEDMLSKWKTVFFRDW